MTMRVIAILIAFLLIIGCSNSADQLRKEASEQFNKRSYTLAKQLLDSLINSGDASYREFFMRGSCKFNLEDYEGAIADYQKVIELGQDKDPEVYYYKGSAQYYLNQFEPAIQDLTMAITLKPENAEALSLRGDSWMATGQIDSALTDFNRSIEINDKLSGPYFSLGNHFASISSYDQALTYYSQAIELEPKPDYLYNRGLIYHLENDMQNAHNDFSYVISLNGSYVDAYIMRGTVKDEVGNSVEALADFNEAIRLDPKNGFAFFNRGITKRTLGDNKGACEDFNKALELGYMEAIAKIGDCSI